LTKLRPELFRLSSERSAAIEISCHRSIGPFRKGEQYVFGKEHLEWLMDLRSTAYPHLTVLDMRTVTGITDAQFKVDHDLYADGAEPFSAALGRKVARLLSGQPAASPDLTQLTPAHSGEPASWPAASG
jgi:hypothetical protein